MSNPNVIQNGNTEDVLEHFDHSALEAFEAVALDVLRLGIERGHEPDFKPKGESDVRDVINTINRIGEISRAGSEEDINDRIGVLVELAGRGGMNGGGLGVEFTRSFDKESDEVIVWHPA